MTPFIVAIVATVVYFLAAAAYPLLTDLDKSECYTICDF